MHIQAVWLRSRALQAFRPDLRRSHKMCQTAIAAEFGNVENVKVCRRCVTRARLQLDVCTRWRAPCVSRRTFTGQFWPTAPQLCQKCRLAGIFCGRRNHSITIQYYRECSRFRLSAGHSRAIPRSHSRGFFIPTARFFPPPPAIAVATVENRASDRVVGIPACQGVYFGPGNRN